MKKILYLSANMESYSQALYQQDVINYIKKTNDVFFYGPGFPLFDPNDRIDDIILKSPIGTIDLICIGHSWLSDTPNPGEIQHFLPLDLRDVKYPKVLFLNKEYVNLALKLKFVKEQRIQLVFTHHHDIEYYSQETGTVFIWWPFAVDAENFSDYGLPKKYDFGFTGILRNPNYPETQTDIRIRIQDNLFYTIENVHLFLRPKFRKYKVVWIPYYRSTNFALASLNIARRIMLGKNRLSKWEYSKILNQTRIWFCSLSPLNLISPRYYEAMATKSLVMCQRSDLYSNLFSNDEHCVMFEDDLSDFEEKLLYYLKNLDKIQVITETAHKHVIENHTWERRIQQFDDAVTSYLGI